MGGAPRGGSAPIVGFRAEGGASPSLLVRGFPVATGRLRPDDALALRRDGSPAALPLWWEPRASWPDGSVRWLFLHARIDAGGMHRLETDPAGIRAGAAAASPVAPSDPGLPDVAPTPSGFTARWPGGGALEVDAGGPFQAVVLEPGPLSGLVRLTGAARDGFAVELLVRTDAVRPDLDVVWRTTRTGAEAAAPPVRRILFRPVGSASAASGAGAPAPREGSDATGTDLVARRGPAVLSVRDGAHRAPCRLEADADGFAAILFDAPDAPPVAPGSSLRQRFLYRGDADGRGDDFACDLPAGWIAGTGALGPVALLSDDEDASVAPGIHRGLRALLERALALADGDDPAYRGVENHGDWPLAVGQYGAAGRRAYADNEYDMPYACALGCAATGDARLLRLSIRGAEHMADVDVRFSDGAMRYHGYADEAEDHRLRRGGESDLGHVWTDGLWLGWLWTGDPFLREAAEGVTRWVVDRFRDRRVSEAFAVCERDLGWPLVVCVSALEHAGPPLADEARFLAQRILRFLDAFTEDPDAVYEDPGMPTWWRTAMQDGCKPFMLGVLAEGLERAVRLDGDPRAASTLDRIAGYLAGRTFDPLRMDFAYEVNAFGPGHRGIPEQQLVPLFVRGLLESGLRRGDGTLLRLAAGAFHASAWCLHDPDLRGKEMALLVRGAVPALAMLEAARERESSARRAERAPSTGRPGTFAGDSPYDGPVPGEGLDTDRGWIRCEYRAGTDDAPSHLNLQAFFHASDVPFDHSAVTLLAFYDRLQVRFHDADRRLVDSLDAFVPRDFFRRASGPHVLAVRYEAPGEAVLAVDGRIAARTALDRALSGAFRRIRVGARPGNWTVNGRVRVEAVFGSFDGLPAELAEDAGVAGAGGAP